MKNVVFKTLMLKGEAGGTITRIEKISASGGVMYMRIYLSDGSTVDFPVNDVPDTDLINNLIDLALTDIEATIADLTTIVRQVIASSSWSNEAPYTCSLSVSGVVSSDNYEIIGFTPTSNAATNKAIKEALSYITYGTTSANTITLVAADKKPSINIPIVLRKVVG